MTSHTHPHPHSHGKPDYGFHGTHAIVLFIVLAVAALGGAAAMSSDPSLAGTLWAIVVIVALHIVAVVLLASAGFLAWLLKAARFRIRDRLLGLMDLQGREHVLDVGCGQGLALVAIARKLPDGRTVGIDKWTHDHGQTENSAETTRSNAEAEGVADRLEILTGDATGLPFEDNSFDIVTTAFMIHHLPGDAARQAAYREMVRVTKPGGRIIPCDVRYQPECRAALEATGCTIERSHRYTAGVPAWMLVARKPAT